ncbi:hypothetical protein OS189_11190 [Sulfitobacter sp. F26169L]|uniref:hypothetical protein n=1 Tax=Sulfitobacter sp. F26169L TaxID=2996015 RepID=UPI002260EBD5|nr:hypothetical protein [Sulfitobacter sp. F26169L]MCX7566904.1 hypothetical protein [Sulfitobacter sp. F26169L]
MISPAPATFAAQLRAIPTGTTTGRANGTRYTATRSDFNAGRSVKLVAEALDGSDYISLNYYDLASGGQLAPCEMPHEKVIAFVMAYQPEAEIRP